MANLKVGSFYWVRIAFDPDSKYITDEPWDAGWEYQPMPARFAGERDGKLYWNCLGMEDESDWPVIWIGEEIIQPAAAWETSMADALKVSEIVNRLREGVDPDDIPETESAMDAAADYIEALKATLMRITSAPQ